MLGGPYHPANRRVCEGADDAFLPTGVDPGPCSSECPVHGPARCDTCRAVAPLHQVVVSGYGLDDDTIDVCVVCDPPVQ